MSCPAPVKNQLKVMIITLSSFLRRETDSFEAHVHNLLIRSVESGRVGLLLSFHVKIMLARRVVIRSALKASTRTNLINGHAVCGRELLLGSSGSLLQVTTDPSPQVSEADATVSSKELRGGSCSDASAN